MKESLLYGIAASNPKLRASLDMIRTKVDPLLADSRHRHFTSHNLDHCDRVIQKLDTLAEQCNEEPNPCEAFVLVASACLHDIGMTWENGSLEQVREDHHIHSYEMIIGSVKDPTHFADLGLPTDVESQILVDSVAIVARGHRKIELTEAEFPERVSGTHEIRLLFMAALLRLGDGLDIDERRVVWERLKTEKDLEVDSKLEWWKHYYVTGVLIRADGLMEVHFKFRKDQKSTDFERAMKWFVSQRLEDEYAKCKDILWGAGVRVSFKRPGTAYIDLGDEPPPEVKAHLMEIAGASLQVPFRSWEELVEPTKKQVRDEIRDKVGTARYDAGLYVTRSIEREFEGFLRSGKVCLVITGKAGVGKTALLCRLAQRYSPSILLADTETDFDTDRVVSGINKVCKSLYGLSLEQLKTHIDPHAKLMRKNLVFLLDGEWDYMEGLQAVRFGDYLKGFQDSGVKFCLACRSSATNLRFIKEVL